MGKNGPCIPMVQAKSPSHSNASRQKTTIEQRRKLFVEAYLSNGGNATKAALAAGFSAGSAAKQGHRLSKNASVRAEIDRRSAEVIEKAQEATQLTIERVMRSLAQALFFDPRKLYREDGSLKPIPELDDDTAQALAGFTKKVKWLDKNTAREQALKHLGAFEKDNKQPNAGLAEAVGKLAIGHPLKAAFDKRLGAKA